MELERENFLCASRSSCLVEQFHSDASLEASGPTSARSTRKTGRGMTEGDNNARRSTLCPAWLSVLTNKHSSLTPGVMVWGLISYHGRSYLPRTEGNVNSNKNVRKVLQPEVLPFLEGIPGAICEQDNACTKDCLRHLFSLTHATCLFVGYVAY
ncbi:uncharacterized protein TNCV_5001561 [Trichonephila clavipes]|nr:uncharacterized protein TNCV_5001561 [Trichonephila clavipes]